MQNFHEGKQNGRSIWQTGESPDLGKQEVERQWRILPFFLPKYFCGRQKKECLNFLLSKTFAADYCPVHCGSHLIFSFSYCKMSDVFSIPQVPTILSPPPTPYINISRSTNRDTSEGFGKCKVPTVSSPLQSLYTTCLNVNIFSRDTHSSICRNLSNNSLYLNVAAFEKDCT